MPNIVWDLIYRDRGVEKGITRIGGAHDNAARKSDAWKKAAAVGFVVVGAAALKFGKDSVRAYGESQAAQQKLAFAFEKFPKLADTNQAALQRLNLERQKSTRFDDDATAAAQAQLAQYKLTGAQLTELTPLLQDYAARTGKDLPTAAKDLGKAVMGQGRALKSVGLDLKDTGTQTGNYNQLVKGLRTQVGGFAEKEGKTAAGQIEILKNQFGELQEQAGAKLVPALSKGVGMLTDLVVVIGENSEVIVPLAAGIGGLTAALWLGHKAAKAYAVVQGVMGAAMASNSRVATGFAAVAGKAGPWGVAVAAGATLLGVFAGQQELAKRQTKAFTDSLTFQKGALDANSAQMLVKKLADEGALEAAKRAGIAEADYVRALMQGGPARDQMLAQLDDIIVESQAAAEAGTGNTAALLDQRDAAAKASDALKLTGGSLDASKRAAELATTGMQGATTATDELTTKTNQLKGAQKNLNTELQKSIDKFTILKEGALSTERANMAWEESVDAVRQSVKDNGRSLDSHTAKGRSNRNAVINMITALNDKVTADVKNAGAIRKGETAQDRYERVQKTATRATKDGIEKIREHARRAHLNKDAVNRMIDEFLKTPSGAGKMGKALEKAKDKVDATRKALEKAARSRTANIKYTTNASEVGKRYGITLSTEHRLQSQGRSRNLATGGVLAGFTPGQDVHHFSSPTGGSLHLSGGEAIMRPEWTRAVGGAGAVNRMNAAARSGSFAGGGVFRLGVNSQGLGTPDFNALSNRIALRLADRLGAAVGRKLSQGYAASGAFGGTGSTGSIRGGGFLGGRLPLAGARNSRHNSGYPWASWAGDFNRGAGAADYGDPVGAWKAGVVAAVNHWGYSYGNHVRINHGGQRTLYAHLSKTSVRAGQRVGAGQIIGNVGNSGNSFGPHLHFEVGGMAKGGVMSRPSVVGVSEAGPERVLTTAQTRMWDRMTRVATSQGVGTTIINISAPNYIGSRQELRQALVDMTRSGAFEVVKR